MGAASVIKGLAAWPRVRAAAAGAAVLLAAFPSAARCAVQGDTVRVEWAASVNESLVIVNAYAVRGGKPAPESVRGLLIERDPAAASASGVRMKYPFTLPDRAYATAEAAPFLAALGLSVVTLDTLANGAAGSTVKNEFDVREWTRLLNRLLRKEGTEIVEGAHRVVIREVAAPVQSMTTTDEQIALFSSGDPRPVFPHLKSGRVAFAGEPEEDARTRSIDFGSIALEKKKATRLYLRNYGVRRVEIEVSVDDTTLQAGFSAGGVQTLVIPAGDSVPVSVEFTPKQAGPRGGTLDFLVGGVSVTQVTLAGRGMSPDIFSRVREWVTARWGSLFALLALFLAILVAWKRGVTLSVPWRQSSTIPDDVGETKQRPEGPSTLSDDPKGSEDAIARQQLIVAQHAIDGALAALGVPAGDKADDRRRLRDLEQERKEWEEGRSGLEERIRALKAERDGLAEKVGALETVWAENTTLRNEKIAAAETLATLRTDVNRLSGEQKKLGARLSAVAGVLELTDEMMSDAGWPETQHRLLELHDGGKPQYLRNFEQLVADLTAIFEEIAPRAGEGRLSAAVTAVLGGSNSNAGLRAVARELERTSLARSLGFGHPRELRTLGPDRFYRDFVDRRFRTIIDNIAKLGVYARSRSPEFGMGQRLTDEGVDPAMLERALALIETRMRVDFGVEVNTVRLFEERFDRSRHDTASHSTLRLTLPDLDASIRNLPSETIYDITSVGLRSEGLGVSVRPVVAWVTGQ